MGFILFAIAVIVIFKVMADSKYRKLEAEVLSKLGFSSWNIISHIDAEVTVKSRQALEKYDDVKYFILRGKSELPCPLPGDLTNPGIKPVTLMSPASAGRFFTPSATWEAQKPLTV